MQLEKMVRDDSWAVSCVGWGVWLREGIQICDKVGKQQTWQGTRQQAQGCKWRGDFCRLDPKSVRENRRNPTNFTNLWTRL